MFPDASDDRSLDLLKACLTEEEFKSASETGALHINTSLGQFTVRGFFNGSTTHPSFNIDDDKGASYCYALEAKGDYPRLDHLLAQVLLLKTNPMELLRCANTARSHFTRPSRIMVENLDAIDFGEPGIEIRQVEPEEGYEFFERFEIKDTKTGYTCYCGIDLVFLRLFPPVLLRTFFVSQFKKARATQLRGQKDIDLRIVDGVPVWD